MPEKGLQSSLVLMLRKLKKSTSTFLQTMNDTRKRIISHLDQLEVQFLERLIWICPQDLSLIYGGEVFQY